MRVAIASDVGDSGHKSAALAIAEAGAARGHQCQEFDPWPDGSVVADRVLFQMFRDYAARGLPCLPPVIELPGLWLEMAADLLPALTLPDVDALVGTHPWAAGILAELASRDGFGGMVMAVGTDFYPFPASAYPRVDIYTGVFPKPVLPPVQRPRMQPLGIPVRAGFAPGAALADRDVLLVTVGARAFVPLAEIVEFASALQRALPGAEVVMCTGRETSVSAVSDPRGAVDIRHGLADLSGLMRRARLVVSRPSGLTVAEALAAGCVPVLLPTDVPWEAEAARHLIYAGLAVALPATRPLDTETVAALWDDQNRIGAIVRTGTGWELHRSVGRIWDLIEAGRPELDPAAPLSPAEDELRTGYLTVLDEAQGTDPMPRTAAFLRQAMLDWYA
jgi:hypothetical protein